MGTVTYLSACKHNAVTFDIGLGYYVLGACTMLMSYPNRKMDTVSQGLIQTDKKREFHIISLMPPLKNSRRAVTRQSQ